MVVTKCVLRYFGMFVYFACMIAACAAEKSGCFSMSCAISSNSLSASILLFYNRLYNHFRNIFNQFSTCPALSPRRDFQHAQKSTNACRMILLSSQKFRASMGLVRLFCFWQYAVKNFDHMPVGFCFALDFVCQYCSHIFSLIFMLQKLFQKIRSSACSLSLSLPNSSSHISFTIGAGLCPLARCMTRFQESS